MANFLVNCDNNGCLGAVTMSMIRNNANVSTIGISLTPVCFSLANGRVMTPIHKLCVGGMNSGVAGRFIHWLVVDVRCVLRTLRIRYLYFFVHSFFMSLRWCYR